MEIEIFRQTTPSEGLNKDGQRIPNAITFSFHPFSPGWLEVGHSRTRYESVSLPMYKVVVPDGFQIDKDNDCLREVGSDQEWSAQTIAAFARSKINGFRIADGYTADFPVGTDS